MKKSISTWLHIIMWITCETFVNKHVIHMWSSCETSGNIPVSHVLLEHHKWNEHVLSHVKLYMWITWNITRIIFTCEVTCGIFPCDFFPCDFFHVKFPHYTPQKWNFLKFRTCNITRSFTCEIPVWCFTCEKYVSQVIIHIWSDSTSVHRMNCRSLLALLLVHLIQFVSMHWLMTFSK